MQQSLSPMCVFCRKNMMVENIYKVITENHQENTGNIKKSDTAVELLQRLLIQGGPKKWSNFLWLLASLKMPRLISMMFRTHFQERFITNTPVNFTLQNNGATCRMKIKSDASPIRFQEITATNQHHNDNGETKKLTE